MMNTDAEFRQHLHDIGRIADLCQNWKRPKLSVSEVASHLELPLSLIYKIFDELGVQPRQWSEPDLYFAEDIAESCCRWEVATRANRA
jgi:hypothetical protein